MSDDDFSTIGFEHDGAVLVVTLDHPDSALNAVDEALHHDLTHLFGRLKLEREARAIVLTGAGRAFSAGGDFAWFPTLQDPERLEHLRLDARQMIFDLLDVHLPVVAAVNGPAMGLGASIALLCDTTFMADTAVIGDPHVRVGLVAGDGGTIAWPLALGPMMAKRFLLTGDSVGAEEAVRLGLAAGVYPADDLLGESIAFARRLTELPPLAVQYTKQAVNAWIKATTLPAFEHANTLEIATFRSDDHVEAVAALVEQRSPDFKGR